MSAFSESPVSAVSEDAWRGQWHRRIRSVKDLHHRLKQRGLSLPRPSVVPETFPVLVTPYYADLIRCADPADPLYRQCVPDPGEKEPRHANAGDPFGEIGLNQPIPGVIRRYRDRAVLVASTDCAVHCRHCTRRHSLSARHLQTAKPDDFSAWLAGEPEVKEIILSGGDPLSLCDAALELLLRQVRASPHVERIRLGTRMPVVLPRRITPSLAALLSRYQPLWVATQFNHPVECTAEAARACERLVNAGIPVGNQAVLLLGINDRVAVMKALFTGLLQMRVKPYYLFHCDPVYGIGHFRVPIECGLALMERLRAEISGLAVPVYVADVPGAPGKVPLSTESVRGRVPGGVRIHLPGGGERILPD